MTAFGKLIRTTAFRLTLVYLFLFALFVLTPAGKWAETYTAVNRLSLQIVPAVLVFAALLWRAPQASGIAVSDNVRMAEAAGTAP